MNARAEDNLPAFEYHRREEISNSTLGDFLESPEYYHARHVAKTLAPKQPTDDTIFGDLFHDSVLMGIDGNAVECPKEVLTKDGKRTGEAFKQFALENAGKSLLLPKDFARLKNMVDAVWAHPMAALLLDRRDAVVEQSVFWEDSITGLKLRSRLDHRSLCRPVITDLKSTRHSSRVGFARTIHDFGYYRQCAFYKEAAKALTGQEHHFIFVAVSKEPPHTVACYDLSERALTLGYEDMRAGLDALQEAYETNHWRSPGWDKVLSLDLPNWAYSNEWETINGYGD